jgi:hypothetical protein
VETRDCEECSLPKRLLEQWGEWSVCERMNRSRTREELTGHGLKTTLETQLCGEVQYIYLHTTGANGKMQLVAKVGHFDPHGAGSNW